MAVVTSWALAQATWTRVLGAARDGHALTYDGGRARTVLFGGQLQSSFALLDDTWEWDGLAWTRRTPATHPTPRRDHALAYDATRGRTVLFGGVDSSTPGAAVFHDDTWEWDGTAWSLAPVAARPSPRLGHALAYDPRRGRTVLFGGGQLFSLGYGNTFLADTWEWDGTSWMRASTATSPSPRMHHRMAFDTAQGKVVLFGGAVYYHTGSLYFGDVWEWDGTSWNQRSAPGGPGARAGHGLAYDIGRGRLVVFGGSSGQHLGDTWEWDGTRWLGAVPVAGPPPRGSTAAAYDLVRGRTVLFGGAAFPDWFSDTWEWDGRTWTVRVPQDTPPSRHGPAMASDSGRRRIVLFGGSRNNGVRLADTWEWTGATWIERTPLASPAGRAGLALAHDSARGRTVLFGGDNLADTWEWDGSTWLQLTPAGGPPPRWGHALAFDVRRQRTVLFGGSVAGVPVADTWEWDGTTWLRASPTSSPAARFAHAMAYDPVAGRTVLFGGMDALGVLGDTWEWDGTAWNARVVGLAPPARFWHGLAFDAARSRSVLFGGTCVTGCLFADTWEWDGVAWTQRSPSTSPVGRWAHGMAFDAATGRTVVFGGASNQYGPDGETWLFAAPCDIAGPGHPGGGGLSMQCQTRPVPGLPFCLSFDSPRGSAFLVLGLGPCMRPPVPVGSPGWCVPGFLYPAPAAVEFVPGSPAGYCLTLPLDGGLVGRSFCAQGMAVEAALCLRATAAVVVTIQTP